MPDYKNIMRHFANISIDKKLLLCLITFIIFPLIITNLIINSRASEKISQKTHEVALETLVKTRFSMNEMVKRVEDLSLIILSDSNLQELLNYYVDESKISFPLSVNEIDSQEHLMKTYSYYLEQSDQDEEKKRFLFAAAILPLYKSMPYISSICISKGDKVINQFGDGVYLEGTDFKNEAEEYGGRTFWTAAYDLKNRVSSSEPKKIISLMRAINDLNDTREIGFERISIEEETICRAYKTADQWKNNRIFLVNSKGTVISSNDKSFLNTRLNKEIYNNKLMQGAQGYFNCEAWGEKVSVFHYQVEGADWKVIQVIPQRELNIEMNAINMIVIACIVFCIAFGILFSLLQNVFIVNPIKRLMKEMNKIKTGDFNVNLRVNSTDEIGSLSMQFIEMAERLKDMIDKVFKSKIKEKEAELIAMQAQINPHFLYNTLDNIRWMALDEGAKAAGEQIETLSRMFRHVLNKGEDMTTVRSEILHLKDYIFIQENRFKDTIKIEIDIDENFMEYKTLKLVLQPLVENAIQHGLQGKVGGGSVRVKVGCAGDKLRYTVSDDGLGGDEERIRKMISGIEEPQSAFALRNINDRIQLKFGHEFGLTFYSVKGSGTRVEVVFPAIKDDAEAE